MSSGKAGVSRRGYAKSRNISESVVRKYLVNGKLASALLADGTLDAREVDRLLMATIERSRHRRGIPFSPPQSSATTESRRKP
jgi:hypothetical protein